MRRHVILLALLGLVTIPSAALAAGARLYKSGPVRVTADGRFAWVSNMDQDTVTRVDTLARTTVECPLPPGSRHAPRGLSVAEDGSEVWVACHDSDQVLVLDGVSGRVVAAIPTGWGGQDR